MTSETEPEAIDEGADTENAGVMMKAFIADSYVVELMMRPAEDEDRKAVAENHREYSISGSFEAGTTEVKIPLDHSKMLPPNVTHILAVEDGIDVMYRQEVILDVTFLRIVMLFQIRTDPVVDFSDKEDQAKELAARMYGGAFPVIMSHASMAHRMMGQIRSIPRMPEDSMVTFETLKNYGGIYPPGDPAGTPQGMKFKTTS